jgi:NADH-quinone oxidoreductase subunit E
MSTEIKISVKKNVLLPDHIKEKIDKWLLKFPPDQKQSAIIYALHLVQDENKGFLTESLMDAVADYLDMPKIAVYEVASFYSMYELSPVGRHKICVCTNVSCMLCGSEKLAEHLQKKLGIQFGETTADGRFTLKAVECLAACGGAPAIQINRIYHENVTPEKMDAILAELK